MEEIKSFVSASYDKLKVSPNYKYGWKEIVWRFFKRVNEQNKYDGFAEWRIDVFRRDCGGLSYETLLGWWQDCEKSPNFTIRYKQLRKMRVREKKPRQLKLVK